MISQAFVFLSFLFSIGLTNPQKLQSFYLKKKVTLIK